ncbi:hypothetical protein N0V83_005580 [Neocucurbitaria cava]|uniref:Uncharacterized protein n=1 Tax=Neocucurbitaria cava TaxID=798079 RepID=A0A9W8Y852_9PLEO|nr:hypothetical protein N0V83_005580 [Neocucurbitaria cava]
MASADDSNNAYSGFLALPTELRCHVYDLLLLTEPACITIGAGRLTEIYGQKAKDRARKTDIPGLSLDLVPMLECRHAPGLLAGAILPAIPNDHDMVDKPKNEKIIYSAISALSQTCRLVQDELTDYMRGKRRVAQTLRSHQNTNGPASKEEEKGLSLYVTYPYGILVLKTLYPLLLKQARRVHISGYYNTPDDIEMSSLAASKEARLNRTNSIAATFGIPTPTASYTWGLLRRPAVHLLTTPTNNSNTMGSNCTSRSRLHLDPPLARRQGPPVKNYFSRFSLDTDLMARKVLAQLVRTVLPAEPTHLIEFSARILYPGSDAYNHVWTDRYSPITNILRNICGGKIHVQVKRGNLGTGIDLTTRPHPESRIVSTTWENWRHLLPRGLHNILRDNNQGIRDLNDYLRGGLPGP